MTLVDEIITHLILPSGWKFPANQLTKEPLNLDPKKGQSQGRGRRAGPRIFQAGGVVNEAVGTLGGQGSPRGHSLVRQSTSGKSREVGGDRLTVKTRKLLSFGWGKWFKNTLRWFPEG